MLNVIFDEKHGRTVILSVIIVKADHIWKIGGTNVYKLYFKMQFFNEFRKYSLKL